MKSWIFYSYINWLCNDVRYISLSVQSVVTYNAAVLVQVAVQVSNLEASSVSSLS